MENCRICKDSMPRFQSFCSHCGARQIASIGDVGTKSILSRLKGFFEGVFYEVFRSDEEKEFDGYNPSWSFDAAIPKLESIVNRVRNKRRVRGRMAIFYTYAGNERVGLWEPRNSSPLGKLSSSYEKVKAEKAKEILSWVSKLSHLREKEFSPCDEAWAGLDEALDGSLSLYDKAINMDPAYHGEYSDRARAFQEVADGILEARRIRPYHRLIGLDSELEGKPVRYGNAELGICIEQETPDLDFAAEVLWLYEQAVKDYKQALSLDPTDTICYVGVSHVLRQLGRKNEAVDYLDRGLAILNKAIIADEHDERSYSERARVFEELGKIELAISDLERLLTLATSKYDLDLTRRKIEELRKGKEARGGGQRAS